MKIDLAAAIATTEELLEALRDLDGTEQDETPTRKGRSQRTYVNRRHAYLAHLADRARVQILDQFYQVRNYDGRDSKKGESEESRSPE